MTRILLILLTILLISRTDDIYAQIENVVVETYYVSDAKDATDTTGINILKAGSATYRVYVDLASGYKLKRLYGDQDHALVFSSSDIIYNNIDRPGAYFGYLINKSWFKANPLLALDSWLSLGLATKTQLGVLKESDPDSSLIGGNYNMGGSAEIPGGLLVNSDPQAGKPLTIVDGLVPSTQVLSQWLYNGFLDIDQVDTTIFGMVYRGTTFNSHSALLYQNEGVGGFGPDNMVLVAQVSTHGDLHFELNIGVIDTNGVETIFVARDAGNHEIVSPFLTYPLACGCRDARYLEYKPYYGCNQPDSCKNFIVCGCMDTLACNYNPIANFSVPGICCYPGYCNNRDLNVVCPAMNAKTSDLLLSLYPNPAVTDLFLRSETKLSDPANITVQNLAGQTIMTRSISSNSATDEIFLDISGLNPGMYLVVYQSDKMRETHKFIKQ